MNVLIINDSKLPSYERNELIMKTLSGAHYSLVCVGDLSKTRLRKTIRRPNIMLKNYNFGTIKAVTNPDSIKYQWVVILTNNQYFQKVAQDYLLKRYGLKVRPDEANNCKSCLIQDSLDEIYQFTKTIAPP